VLLTSRDYALRLALSLVIATEAALFALLILLGDNFVPHLSVPVVVAAIALVAAARCRPQRMLAFVATALVAELVSLPSHGKAITLLAGLHAALVLSGGFLVIWTLALPRWRRAGFARLTSRYWYFVAIAWLIIGPLVCAHRP
jgi:hypothetical protein